MKKPLSWKCLQCVSKSPRSVDSVYRY